MKGVLKNIKRRFSKETGQGSPTIGTGRRLEARSHTIESNSDAQMIQSAASSPSKRDLLDPLPTFRDCASSERQALMIRKLRLCSIVFDFNNESQKYNLGKEMKRTALLDLVDYISTTKNWFSETALQEILDMVSANLFRSLPPSPNEDQWDPEEDEPVLDAAWPHLQIVYEFLLRFIVSTDTDTKIMKKYINGPFVFRVLGLFNSEDPRERDYLKTILHRIYGKFMSLRSFIRKAINNVFFTFVYDTERHNGVGELLEILGRFIASKPWFDAQTVLLLQVVSSMGSRCR